MAKIGLKVKVKVYDEVYDSVIDTIFDNRYIYCRFLHPTKRSGAGAATTCGITTDNNEIVKHPNYFKLLN